ncbi:MAG: NAD(P)/FAD-dependent oxidoreductase [Blastocatellia bacterium]
MKPPESCLIIGAGMAGLMAARTLQAGGVRVTLLDKGRGPGGRMATRRVETPGGARGYFDHGAQFFTVRDARFARYVAAWTSAGLAREWSRGFAPMPDTPADLINDGHPRYCGTAGMNAIPRHLAQGLDLRLNALVERLDCDERTWRAHLASGETVSAAALILTPPVPQSLVLLGRIMNAWPAALRQALARITYDPCFAILATLSGPSGLPDPGALQLSREPIAWIADNHRKGISPAAHTVTIHAGPVFTRAHQDMPHDTVARLLLDMAQFWLKASVQSWQTHRWRYSQPRLQYPHPCLLVRETPPLVFAGDAFGAPRIEGAALSGMAAAAALCPGPTDARKRGIDL